MKNGIKIVIQENLSSERKEAAEKYALGFMRELCETGISWKHLSRGGYGENGNVMPLRRNVVGVSLPSTLKNFNLFFRRISKKKRIFAIMSGDDILLADGTTATDHSSSLCRCNACLGGMKAKAREGIEFENFIEIGNWDLKR